ncbi:MAG: hypothetical protein ABL860_03085, partial [Candidatus Nitrotoga sp.]
LHEPRCRPNCDDRKAHPEGQGLFSLARGATQRACNLVATHAGHGFTDGLHCRKANQGNDPWRHLAPCIPSRKADVAAMWD